MTHNFEQFYDCHLKRLSRRLAYLEKSLIAAKKNLNSLLNLRLTIAALTIGVALPIASGPEYRNWGALFLFFLGLFLWLVIKSRKLRRWHHLLDTWKTFNLRQVTRLQMKQLNSLPQEKKTLALNKEDQILSRDLHLLGDNSLFSLINETFTSGGRTRLIRLLLHPLNHPHEITQRQNQIKSLASRPWLMTRFFLLGHSCEVASDSQRLRDELKKTITEKGYGTYAVLHVIFYSLLLFVLAKWLRGSPVFRADLALGAYFLFSLVSLTKTAKGFTRGESLSLSLEGLIPVYQWLEQHYRVTKKLTPITLRLKPTSQLKLLHFYLSCLSIQAHALVFLIVNTLFPWTYLWAGLLEQWRKKHYSNFTATLDELENLEALGSLALFHHYQSQVFPDLKQYKEKQGEIQGEKQEEIQGEISTQGLFHPLIDRQKVVANDFELRQPARLGLITGSNMSGKSTFLRALGLNQHLAMVGAPVFADRFETFVGPVITCLQIRDSLKDGYSSFYYEVKRVKEVIERAEKGEFFLYLVDEIFRGTNNRERLKGSQSVIKKLVHSPAAIGLISTHDLELTLLEKEFPELQNGHFRDEVKKKSKELHFSYQYYPGPCPTTNALKIMAAEGLPVEL